MTPTEFKALKEKLEDIHSTLRSKLERIIELLEYFAKHLEDKNGNAT